MGYKPVDKSGIDAIFGFLFSRKKQVRHIMVIYENGHEIKLSRIFFSSFLKKHLGNYCKIYLEYCCIA